MRADHSRERTAHQLWWCAPSAKIEHWPFECVVILSFLARRAGFLAFRSGRPPAHVLAARTRERRKCFA